MPITTSNEPWMAGPGGQLLDAQGNPIAAFNDWRDRDRVIELKQLLEDEQDRCEQLEIDIENLEEESEP